MDDVISTETSEEILYLFNEIEEGEQPVALTSNVDDFVTDVVAFDTTTIVDPLDELLDQKTSLI